MTHHEQSAIVGYWRMTESIPLVAESIGFTDDVKKFIRRKIMPSNEQIIQFQQELVTQVLKDKKLIQNYGK